MSAVILEDRRKRAAGKPPSPRAIEDTGDYHFVPLVELRKRSIQAEVRRILWAVIGVEVGGCIKSFAVRVVSENREVIAEAFFHFYNQSFVKSRSSRGVLVILSNERIHEARRHWLAKAV